MMKTTCSFGGGATRAQLVMRSARRDIGLRQELVRNGTRSKCARYWAKEMNLPERPLMKSHLSRFRMDAGFEQA